jgi:hypothetical protein
MSLAEQLKLNYCNTDALLTVIEKDPSNPYCKVLAELKAKQDARLVVSNLEYEALPSSGAANYWSAAHGYYSVNFHYNFFNPKFVDKVALVDRFVDFLSVVAFIDCRESEVVNWRTSFDYFIKRYKAELPESYIAKSEWVSSILSIVDPINKKSAVELASLDRDTCSKLFDNVAWYFKFSEYCNNKIVEKYKNTTSLKAKDVMEILNISRQTLSNYVKQGLVKVDSTINGKYKYNKESVLALMNAKI